jgi:hypothetical protein
MKVLRVLLVAACVLVALLVIVSGLAFMSSVQTWAARKALASQPDMKGDVQRVDVGFKQVQLQNLRIEQPGMVLHVPSATIDLPVPSAAREKVLIRRAVAKGWTLDLTAPAAAAAPQSSPPPQKSEKPQSRSDWTPHLAVIGLAQVQASAASAQPTPAPLAAFEGIFRLLKLPVDLEVDGADLEGDVIFPTKPGDPAGRAHVVITGGGLGTGKTGHFKITSVAKLNGANAPVSDVTADGVVEARMSTPRTFDSVVANLDVRATGAQFPQGAKLRLELKAENATGKESYSLVVRTVENGGGKQLVDVRATFPADTRHLIGSWKVDARDADVAPFALGFPLLGFIAAGNGSFEADADFKEVHAIGRFESTLERLETLRAPLAALGKLRLIGDFDVVQHGDSVRIQRFTTDVVAAKPVLSIHALQGIEFNPKTRELKVADPHRDLLLFKLEGVPLAWLQAFVRDVSIGGDDVKGEFVANARNGGVVLRTTAPLTVRRLAVSKDGEALLQGVDLTAKLDGEYASDGWLAEVPELTLGSAEQTWMTVALKAGQASGENQPLKSTGQFQIDLPTALRQPAVAGLADLTKGKAFGDFSAVLTDTVNQIATRVELRELAALGVDRPIPTTILQVRADLQADGVIKLQAPVLLQQGDRRSDLELTGEIRPLAAKRTITAQLVSDLLYVEDAQILLAPLRGSPTKPKSSTPRSTKPDTEPFWKDLTGELQIALKKVVYSPDVQAANVSGNIKISPQSLTLDNIRAVMGENSDARVNGGLRFDAKAKEPYSLNADVNVNNVDPGPILALLSPEGKPTAEGHFNVVGKFSGTAANSDMLGERTSADLKLTSRGGRFNGFAASAAAADFGKVQKGASALLGLAAGVFGESKYEKYISRTKAATDFVGKLATIEFDQLNLEVTHRPGEATQIKDFSLISPEIRFIGIGGIENTPGLGLLSRPLHLDLQLAVRGEQANNMRALGAVREEPDALGYLPMVDKVPIQGSLSKISADALVKYVTRQIARD